MEENSSIRLPHDIVYREGDNVRKLRGLVHDVERLGFVRVDGLSKEFWINPRYIERIEKRLEVEN